MLFVLHVPAIEGLYLDMDYIGFTGYLISGTSYLVFMLLLLAARNKSSVGLLILICAATNIFASTAGALQIHFAYSLKWVLIADCVKAACWAVLVLSCTSESTGIRNLLRNIYIQKYLVVWFIAVISCWTFVVLFNISYEIIFLLFISLNLWNLVLLEQLFRNAEESSRQAILPLVIAVGTVSVFDFVVYSQAVMVGAIDFDFWYSRGFISAFIVPFLIVSVRRLKNGVVRVFVSRNVVFYSSMLLIAGLYLLVMASAGYVINYFGGEWGGLISITFLMLGGVVLVVLLMTESLRRKVKVFIAKHFFANKYEYREEWLSLIEKIETTSAENYYQMATKIMMSKLHVGHGAIVKRITDVQFSVQYCHGLEFSSELNKELEKFARFSHQYGWLIDIQEYIKSPSVYKDLSLDKTLCLKHDLSIIIPIFIGKAFYGMFIFAKPKEPEPLNWEDRDLLFAISKQLGNFISLHEANDKLAESKQFDAFNRMSAFLVHDLKNVQAQLGLINVNAEKHRSNPDFIDDVFETIDSATQRLDKVLNQLRKKQVAQSESVVLSLTDILSKVVKQRNIVSPKVELEIASEIKMRIDGETFYSVLNHLIQNAQEATVNDEEVHVSVYEIDGYVRVDIKDSGCGMSQEFIKKRLFKPFDTTKGNAGMGIGVFEAKQFIEGIAGTIEVDSIVGKGTTFQIMLPLNPVFSLN